MLVVNAHAPSKQGVLCEWIKVCHFALDLPFSRLTCIISCQLHQISLMLECVYIQPTWMSLAHHSHTDQIFFYIPAFTSIPTSVNATLGSTATFNCSATAGALTWLVNGSLLLQLNIPDITTSNIGRLSFLHVPATEEYNNTNMTCVVFTLNHRETEDLFSDPAILRVQGTFGM